MHEYAVVVTAQQHMARSQRTRRRLPYGVAVGLAIALVVAGVLAWQCTRHRVVVLGASEAATLAVADQPSDPQLLLPVSFTTHDPTGGDAYTVALPAVAEYAATEPAAKGATSLGSVQLGSRGERLVLLSLGTSFGSAREALEHVASKVQVPSSEIRTTLVGSTPALAQDFDIGPGPSAVREFRFVHGGRLFSAGIIWRTPQALDAGLAALRTLTWKNP